MNKYIALAGKKIDGVWTYMVPKGSGYVLRTEGPFPSRQDFRNHTLESYRVRVLCEKMDKLWEAPDATPDGVMVSFFKDIQALLGSDAGDHLVHVHSPTRFSTRFRMDGVLHEVIVHREGAEVVQIELTKDVISRGRYHSQFLTHVDKPEYAVALIHIFTMIRA